MRTAGCKVEKGVRGAGCATPAINLQGVTEKWSGRKKGGGGGKFYGICRRSNLSTYILTFSMIE